MGGHLHIIHWLQQLGVPWYRDVRTQAALCGHLHVLQWFREQDPPCAWGEKTCEAAAQNGKFHILQWLRHQQPPCPWSKDTCTAAAAQGKPQLKMLQWLREQDPPCPWGVETCAAAAQRDDLIVLRWLRAQEPACPSDATTCTIARKHDPIVGWRSQPKPQVLAWALLHGCPPVDPRHEKLRSQLVFLACIKRQEQKRIYTRACRLGLLFSSLPSDVIKYIAELL